MAPAPHITIAPVIPRAALPLCGGAVGAASRGGQVRHRGGGLRAMKRALACGLSLMLVALGACTGGDEDLGGWSMGELPGGATGGSGADMLGSGGMGDRPGGAGDTGGDDGRGPGGSDGTGGSDGAPGSGGIASTGGAQGTGGIVGAGGAQGAGGVQGSGGVPGTGGVQGSGGGEGPLYSEGCTATSPVPGSTPARTRKVRDLTGTGTSSGRFGVGGTDLGIPVRQPDGKIAYIFGDTFEQDTVGGPGWRSPVLLRSEPGLSEHGIEFIGAAGGGYAKQILDYAHDNGRTWLPTDAITLGGRMYLHYVVNQGLGNVLWSQIAYSDDNGENWAVSGARWEAGESDSLQQLWTWEHGCDGYVYVLSTKFISRDRPIILHRVPDDRLLEHDAYEPWGYQNGQWAWGNPATPVLQGRFGEMSLRRVERKFVLAWFNAGDYEITLKVFDSPTSNLNDARTYHPIRGGSWGAENDSTVAQLYGGYIHPDSTLHNLHLIVSQWNTDANWPYRSMQFVTGVD